MSAYVDIHSHVLPGIDDGPADLDGAVAMARAAAEAGTCTLVATPHLRPDFPDVHLDQLPARCREVCEGILLQVNAESLLAGDRRSGPRRLAELLCMGGLAHALASDGHRASSWRPVTNLAKGVEAAAALVGPERAEWMAREAPAAIVGGQALPEPPEAVQQHRKVRPFGRR